MPSGDESNSTRTVRNQKRTSSTWQRTFLILLTLCLFALGVSLLTGSQLIQYDQTRSADSFFSNKDSAVNLSHRDNKSIDKLLSQKVQALDRQVREIKATGVIMERDPHSLTVTKQLQQVTRELLHARYGPHEPYRVRVVLEFQEGSPEFTEKGPDGSILLELAPSALQPHSIFMFLEVARQYKGGAFHRIAGHVLQAMVRGNSFKPLAFQEYSEEYPHKLRTVGYAGRPSGPGWYVSIQDNTKNHGPGSQQKKNPYEADSCFGKVIEGWDNEVQRIARIPERGFLRDKKKHVLIRSMIILVPDGSAGGGYVEWKDTTTE